MIRERIKLALKDAEGSDDDVRSCTLRLMLAAIRDRDLALAREESAGELGEREMIDLLARMIAQRERSCRDYEETGHLDLAERERAEIKVITEFLPRKLTSEECEAAIRGVIAETNATSIRDMGRVMSALKQRYPGRIDFCDCGAKVKAALA